MVFTCFAQCVSLKKRGYNIYAFTLEHNVCCIKLIILFIYLYLYPLALPISVSGSIEFGTEDGIYY